MANFWFDITTTVHWRRPPVGVVRVEVECFKYLHGLNDPSVRFCYFDKHARRYDEITGEDALRLLALHGKVEPVAAPPPAAKRAKERAIEMLERFPRSVSEPVRKLGSKTTPLLRSALHKYRQATATMSSLGEQFRDVVAQPPRPPGVENSHPAHFEPGDVLASSGLDWDHKEGVHLYQLKLALGLKVILFCYDLIPVLLPHLCVGEVAGIFARYFVDVAWCADEVMCISRCSQRDFLSLVRETGAPEPKTSIIRLGANLPARKDDSTIDELVKGKYLLFVSTIERRKNHEVLYRAIAQLVEQGRTELPLMVFVGMQGWGVSDFLNDLRLDPRVRGRFLILNHVTDTQLSLLYSHAEFTLYPSLYEGWGLPLAESLAHGKFCLASNSSSLPEVGGSLVEYIDPWESRRWAERIAWYLDHPAELVSREQAIREKYRAPLWEDAGRTLHQAAKALMSPNPT